MHLEVRWVEDLLLLEQEGSISKAAEKRFVSQSAFTRRIQQLEDMVGKDVIIRNNKKNIEFTDTGYILLMTCKIIKKQLDETARLLKNMHDEPQPTIRFAVAHSLVSSFLPTFLQKMPLAIDELKIEIVASNIGAGLALLKQGECDFLVCYSDHKHVHPMNDNILSGVKIAETELLPVSVIEHGQPKFNLQRKFPLLSYSHKAYLRSLVDELITDRLNYKSLYETDNAANLKDLVLQGLGVAWVPKIAIEHELKTQQLAILDRQDYMIQQDIFIYKNNLNHSAHLKQIWAALSNDCL